MEFKEINGNKLALIGSDELRIAGLQDILDLMADCMYNGVHRIILHEENLPVGFFDLKTGIAGEILQKFSTYGMKLSIIGEFSKYNRRSLSDFIFESNKNGSIYFARTAEEAIGKA
jgi:hypothetical protein